MTARELSRPKKILIKRSDLRQNLRETLEQATGRTVVEISAHDPKDEKLLVDKNYFDELVQRVGSLVETLEISTNQKFFDQILRASETLEEDIRRGRLHSFEEAFGEK
jgi:hypothetical protein